jgi:Transposase family tnp2
MVRKRSISSVLDENPTTTRTARITVRSIVQPRSNKVPCYCSNCEGNLVNLRTKSRHELLSEVLANVSAENLSQPLPEILENLNIQGNDNNESYQPTTLNEQKVDEVRQDNLLPRKREARYISTRVPISDLDSSGNLDSSSRESIPSSEDEIDDNDSNEDNEPTNTILENFEDYSCPSFEPFQEPNVAPTNNQSLWILLWIMKFRTRFNISETATESLIKFIKLILEEIGGINNTTFKDFPTTLYNARNTLGLADQFHSFVVCTKCHKLYNKQEVKEFRQDGTLAIMKCQHIEFPNSSRRRMCQTPLSHQTKLLHEVSNRIEIIYPFSSIRQQLATLYLQSGFEKSLRHWADRSDFDNILTDIYDGRIWKTFKETSDHNSINFFRPEVADSNLGLMLNLDWFQPYEGTTHSTGVIYAAICNLPRDIRFKRENLLILGILPGPHEVSLHKINHYLAPIVDELESLWSGLTLNRTFECQNGKNIRAGLILVLCDIPVVRKICGHVSALVSCHRCKKRANYENRQNNFAGMDNMDEWFINRDSAEHRENALGWRRCNSDAS